MPDLHNIAAFVNMQITKCQSKSYLEKYLWLGELINYFCNKEYERYYPHEYYKMKTYYDEKYEFDLLCDSFKYLEKPFLFFYPKVYTISISGDKVQYQLDHSVYNNSFEENIKLIIRQKNKSN